MEAGGEQSRRPGAPALLCISSVCTQQTWCSEHMMIGRYVAASLLPNPQQCVL